MSDINKNDLNDSAPVEAAETLRPRRQKPKFDRIYIAFAAGVLVVSLISFFFTRGNSIQLASSQQTNLVAIGKIASVRGDFRRRVPNGFNWGTIATGDSVFGGDTLFTGEDSEAQIELAGSELSIDANSLLNLKIEGGISHFDLQYGSLLQKIDKAQTILVGNGSAADSPSVVEKIVASKAEIRFTNDGSGKGAIVQVVSGEIQVSRLNGAKGETKTAHKDEIAKLDPQGEILIESPSVALVSPKIDEAFWLAPGLPVKFSWKRSSNQEVLFEVARDSQFQIPVFKQKMASDSYEFAADKRPEGVVYWRVTTSDRTSVTPLPWRVQIYQDGAPAAQSPTNNQQLAFTSNSGAPGKTVLFSWDDQMGSTSYDLQVAKDDEFKTVVYKNTLSQKSDSSTPLTAGNYYWHVMGKNSNRKTPHWSRALAFTITDDKKLPARPEIVKKQLTFSLTPQVLKSLTPDQEIHGKGFPVTSLGSILPAFAWKTAADADTYEVQFSPDREFKNAPQFQIKNGLQFSPTHVKPGSVFARVRGVSKSGLAGPYSETMALTVFLPAPALSHVPYAKELFATKKEFEEARHEFKVTWASQPFAERYELQWAADKDFKLVRNYQVKEHFRVQTVSKPFDYFARVRTIDRNGNALSAFSETRIVKYQKQLLVADLKKTKAVKPIAQQSTNTKREPAGVLIATLPKPSAISPESDTSLTTFENQKATVNFKWKKVAVAQEYQVQIAADPEFENIVGTVWSPETQGKFNGFFPEGKVYWRVRTITKAGYGEWSDISDFNVLWE